MRSTNSPCFFSLSLSFFDPEHGLHGTARAAATLMFEGDRSKVLAEGPRVETKRDGWRAELGDAFSLELRPVAPAAELDGCTVQLCEVKGRVGGEKVGCLGTVSETHTPPAWDELDAVRSISALFDSQNAFLAVARRERGIAGHGLEQVSGWLLRDGEPITLEDTRISTVYDGEGRQRSAGLELWLPEVELPRRGAGTVIAGSSLQLEGIDVHAAVFGWRMEDREGAGAYELWVRSEPEAA